MRFLPTVLLCTLSASPVIAQLPTAQQEKIAALAQSVLRETGVPAASIAVAQGDRVVYAQAFGLANVAKQTPITPSMALPIGSISKQFTAQAALLLQQQGKLSIDDPVSKYFPNFTDAQHVTLRNLMTMTSGYEDFAPQDYIIPAWRQSIDSLRLVTEWATKPLDFQPGTEWQYSNTNYVMLALIVEKVSGEPLVKFLRENFFQPLHLEGVFDTYEQRDKLQVLGYVSYAMQPVHVQPLEGNGWYMGDGELSIPASTLAEWDLGIADRKLLSPASYKEFETPFVLANGKDSGYGLGVFVRTRDGRRMIEHSGEVGGYVAENVLYPEDKIAIVVLTNEVASEAASQIAAGISHMLLQTNGPAAPAAANPTGDKLAAQLRLLQQGQIDAATLTPDTLDYFSADARSDFQKTLAPLGALQNVTLERSSKRGGMDFGLWKATFAKGAVTITTYLTADGRFEQLLIVGKA